MERVCLNTLVSGFNTKKKHTNIYLISVNSSDYCSGSTNWLKNNNKMDFKEINAKMRF
jgi:hypothetical protein